MTIAGEIVYISALNMVIIVLNSEEVVNELLKGRSGSTLTDHITQDNTESI
jgi:hypothetical protein